MGQGVAILSGVQPEVDPDLLDAEDASLHALASELRPQDDVRAALFRSLLRRLGLKTLDRSRPPPPLSHLALLAGGLPFSHPMSANLLNQLCGGNEFELASPTQLDTGDPDGIVSSTLVFPAAGRWVTTHRRRTLLFPHSPTVCQPLFVCPTAPRSGRRTVRQRSRRPPRQAIWTLYFASSCLKMPRAPRLTAACTFQSCGDCKAGPSSARRTTRPARRACRHSSGARRSCTLR